MAKHVVVCPECKTKNKVAKQKSIVTCKKCGHPIIQTVPKKEKKGLFSLFSKQPSPKSKSMQQQTLDIKQAVQVIYHEIVEDFNKQNRSAIASKLEQLYTIDNTYDMKYLFLLLYQLKVYNTVDAYDAFRKLNKHKQYKLLQSNYMQRLHNNYQFRPLIEDLIRHAYVRRRPSEERIQIAIGRGQ